ncbi:hypothetical protein BTVI_102023 [Pitangus sulphuratus]|nr:hypothetical protein BTVI_102023 [Pitangus sulphuratus]
MKPDSLEMSLRVASQKSAAQLECMYTNAHSMDKKQQELEAIVQQESNDVVTIMDCGGRTCLTGVLQWMATSSSEETGEFHISQEVWDPAVVWKKECFGCADAGEEIWPGHCPQIRAAGQLGIVTMETHT